MLAGKFCATAAQHGIDTDVCRYTISNFSSCVDFMKSIEVKSIRNSMCGQLDFILENKIDAILHKKFESECSSDLAFTHYVCSETLENPLNINSQRLYGKEELPKPVQTFFDDLSKSVLVYVECDAKSVIPTDAWATRHMTGNELVLLASPFVEMYKEYIKNPSNSEIVRKLLNFQTDNNSIVNSMTEAANQCTALSYFQKKHPTSLDSVKNNPKLNLIYRYHYLCREFLLNKMLKNSVNYLPFNEKSMTVNFFKKYESRLFPKSSIFSGEKDIQMLSLVSEEYLKGQMTQLLTDLINWAQEPSFPVFSDIDTSQHTLLAQRFVFMLPPLILNDHLKTRTIKISPIVYHLENLIEKDHKTQSNGLSSPFYLTNWIESHEIEVDMLANGSKFDICEIMQKFIRFIPGEVVNLDQMYRDNKENFQKALDLKWKSHFLRRKSRNLSFTEIYALKSVVESFMHVSTAMASYIISSPFEDLELSRKNLITGNFFSNPQFQWEVYSPVSFTISSIPECDTHTILLDDLYKVNFNPLNMPSKSEFKKVCDEIANLKPNSVVTSVDLLKTLDKVNNLKKQIMLSAKSYIINVDRVESKNFRTMNGILSLLDISSNLQFDFFNGIFDTYTSAFKILQPVMTVLDAPGSLSIMQNSFRVAMSKTVTEKWIAKNTITPAMNNFISILVPSHVFASIIIDALKSDRVISVVDIDKISKWHQNHNLIPNADSELSNKDPLEDLYNTMTDAETVSTLTGTIINLFLNKLTAIDEKSVHNLITSDVMSIYDQLQLDRSKLNEFRTALPYKNVFQTFYSIFKNQVVKLLTDESTLAPYIHPVVDPKIDEIKRFIIDIRKNDNLFDSMYTMLELEPLYTAYVHSSQLLPEYYDKSIYMNFFSNILSKDEWNKIRGVYLSPPSSVGDEKQSITSIVGKITNRWVSFEANFMKQLTQGIPSVGLTSFIYQNLLSSFTDNGFASEISQNMLNDISKWITANPQNDMSISPDILSILLKKGPHFNMKTFNLIVDGINKILDIFSTIDPSEVDKILSKSTRDTLTYYILNSATASDIENLMLKIKTFLKVINDKIYLNEFKKDFQPLLNSLKLRINDNFHVYKQYYSENLIKHLGFATQFVQDYNIADLGGDFLNGAETFNLNNVLIFIERYFLHYKQLAGFNYLIKATEYFYENHPALSNDEFGTYFRNFYRILNLYEETKNIQKFSKSNDGVKIFFDVCIRLQSSPLVSGEFFEIKHSKVMSSQDELKTLIFGLESYKNDLLAYKYSLPDLSASSFKKSLASIFNLYSLNLLMPIFPPSMDSTFNGVISNSIAECEMSSDACSFHSTTDKLLEFIRLLHSDSADQSIVNVNDFVLNLLQHLPSYSPVASLRTALIFCPGFNLLTNWKSLDDELLSKLNKIPLFQKLLFDESFIGVDVNRLSVVFFQTSTDFNLSELYKVAHSLLELLYLPSRFILSTFDLSNEDLITLNTQVTEGTYFEGREFPSVSAVPMESINKAIDLLTKVEYQIESLKQENIDINELSFYDDNNPITLEKVGKLKNDLELSKNILVSANFDTQIQKLIDLSYRTSKNVKEMSHNAIHSILRNKSKDSYALLQTILVVYFSTEIDHYGELFSLQLDTQFSGLQKNVNEFYLSNKDTLNKLIQALNEASNDFSSSKILLLEAIEEVEKIYISDSSIKFSVDTEFEHLVSKIAANGLQLSMIYHLHMDGFNYDTNMWNTMLECMKEKLENLSVSSAVCATLKHMLENDNAALLTLKNSVHRFTNNILSHMLRNSLIWQAFPTDLLDIIENYPLYPAVYDSLIRSKFNFVEANAKISSNLHSEVKSVFDQIKTIKKSQIPLDPPPHDPNSDTSTSEDNSSLLLVFLYVALSLVILISLGFAGFFLYKRRKSKSLLLINERLV